MQLGQKERWQAACMVLKGLRFRPRTKQQGPFMKGPLMAFKIIALAIIGVFAYSFQGFDGDHALYLAALPVVAALTFILLGPG
jgi:hypothetical protein